MKKTICNIILFTVIFGLYFTLSGAVKAEKGLFSINTGSPEGESADKINKGKTGGKIICQAIPPNAPYRNSKLPPEERVKDLLARMTLEEKFAQLMHQFSTGVIIKGDEADQESLKKVIGSYSPGVICSKIGTDLYEGAKMLAACQRYLREKTRLGIPALTTNEALHGVIAKGATIYPQFIALGCTWNPELAMEMGTQISEEATAAGLNNLLTPMIDVIRDPRWGRVEECIGESPFHVGAMCTAYTLGIQGDIRNKPLAAGKSLAMIKTFTGFSMPENGICTSPCNLGERELRSTYFPPTEQVIRETGVLSLMPSYNEVDGIPSHSNKWLLEEVLRGEMGFRGYTYSDWGGVPDLKIFHYVAGTFEDAGRMAIEAGVDMDAPWNRCYQYLGKLVADNKISVSVIDKAVSHILYTKFVAGLFDGRPDADLANLKNIIHSPDHVALSQKIAEESIVLLKNENDLLPLDLAKIKSLAVIGPNADQVQFGDYTWTKSNTDGVTILKGLRERLGNKVSVTYEKGCHITDLSKAGFPAAVAAAEKADATIVIIGDTSQHFSGLGYEVDSKSGPCTVGEGYDVTDPIPPGVQQDLVRELLKTGKPVVVIFLNGRPYSVPWMKEQVPAIVEAFYPGEMEGYAVADVLLGNVNPSGRLSMTIPQSAGHIPAVHDYKPSGRAKGNPGSKTNPGQVYVFSSPLPLWEFGYGLSYTTFSYSDLKIETPEIRQDENVIISFTLTNTGKLAGKEVAQVYLRDDVSSVSTPVKKLVGFTKPSLKPGESKRVTVTIPNREMALWSIEMKRVVEPGTFTIMIASSAESVKLQGKYTVTSRTQ